MSAKSEASTTEELESDYDVVIETRLRCTVRVSSRSQDRDAAIQAAVAQLFDDHAAGWVCADDALDRVDDRYAVVGYDFWIGEVVERDENGNEIGVWFDDPEEVKRLVND